MTELFLNYAPFAAWGSFAIAISTIAYKAYNSSSFTGYIRNLKFISKAGIALLFLGALSTFFYGRATKDCPIDKKRVVIMLPCNNELGAAWADGVRQVLGITEFFRKHHAYTEEFEFRFVDHSMQYDGEHSFIAEEIIEEIKKGTKYFICTMSKVAVPLSKDFENLVKLSNYKGSKPILISTVASSPEVHTNLEDIFRFYIRSSFESNYLAQEGINNGYKKASYIVVAGAYGDGAINEFSKTWEKNNGLIVNGLKLDDKLDEEAIIYEVEKFKEYFEQVDVIFLAHYGEGVSRVIKALSKLNVKKPIISSHTITIPDWKKPIEDELKKLEVHTCSPKWINRSDNYPDMVYEDVISGFMYLTMDKLVYTIRKSERQNSTFSEIWKLPYPPIVKSEFQENGDFEILLNYE